MSFPPGNQRRNRITAALAALGTTACVSAPDSIQAVTTHAAAGRYLVEANCASCHAIGLTDRSKHRDAPALRTLSQSYPVSALEESLAEGIVVGHPDMPEFRFQAEEVAAIVIYLESIQQPHHFHDDRAD